MKTTDILLSPEMARARAEGRKTQTRRVVKQQPVASAGFAATPFRWSRVEGVGHYHHIISDNPPGMFTVTCPYGQPGDRILWLTTWAVNKQWDDSKPSDIGIVGHLLRLIGSFRFWSYHDSATKPDWCGKLRPGLSMPLFLRDRMPVDELIGVRAERLQDISEEDAKAEGIVIPRCGCEVCATSSKICPADASEYILSYRSLWERINGYGSWDLNPWVLVLEWKGTK